MPNKYCHKCKTEKSVDQFYNNRSKEDGLSTHCKECNKNYNRKYQKEHPDKVRAIQKRVYKKMYANPETRRKLLDKNRRYNKRNQNIIREWARRRNYIKKGLPVKRKTFVFYRDVICHWMKNLIESAPKWELLLSLPLTPKQREIVVLTRSGLGVLDISKQLNKQQSTITKMWNGCFSYEHDKFYGGIYSKVRKYMPQLLEPEYEQYHRLQTITFRRNNEEVFPAESVSVVVDGE